MKKTITVDLGSPLTVLMIWVVAVAAGRSFSGHHLGTGIFWCGLIIYMATHPIEIRLVWERPW